MAQRVLTESAIGIHGDDDVGWIEAQVLHPELQCIAVAAVAQDRNAAPLRRLLP